MNHGTTRGDDCVTYEFLVWRHASVSFANTARLFPRASVGIKRRAASHKLLSARGQCSSQAGYASEVNADTVAPTGLHVEHRYQLGRVSGFPWFRAARSLKRRGNNTI